MSICLENAVSNVWFNDCAREYNDCAREYEEENKYKSKHMIDLIIYDKRQRVSAKDRWIMRTTK